MRPSTKNQAKGTLENLKGRIKEIAGVVTGRRRLEAEGKDQALAGKARKKLGQAEKVVGK
ncbi:MAG TPA: CsbD family protein [Anaeromyxobacter sp.]